MQVASGFRPSSFHVHSAIPHFFCRQNSWISKAFNKAKELGKKAYANRDKILDIAMKAKAVLGDVKSVVGSMMNSGTESPAATDSQRNMDDDVAQSQMAQLNELQQQLEQAIKESKELDQFF